MKSSILAFFLLLSVGIYAHPTSTSNIKAIEELAKRVLDKQSKNFRFELKDAPAETDIFEIETVNNKVVVRGNSGVTIAAGLNYYLKNYCHNSTSWLGSNIHLPASLPVVSPAISIRSNYIYRPYMNYCTLGYSTPFWDWNRWEKELDWMALNGINMPLLMVGQEAVWQRVLRKFNFTEQEIANFIPGPGYVPWWLMQNLEGEGGPVSQAYIDARAELQKKIVARAKALGMTPIFQGFFGMVPTKLADKYPTEKIYNTGKWGGGYQRPAQLNPESKLFPLLAEAWYLEQAKLYGTSLFYGGDPFHEGSAPKDVDLYKTGTIIQSFMQQANPRSTWVLQCWQDKPYDKMLAGTDPAKILILELSGEGYKFWQNRNNTKYPWVYSIINNYGGKQGMYGRFNKVVADLNYYLEHAEERKLKGLGITPEGIENNPVAYEMMFDFVWKYNPTTVADYIKEYSLSRYGSYDVKLDSAWNILVRTAFNCPKNQEGTTESILCARPGLKVRNVSTWSGAYEMYYSPAEFNTALHYFISCSDKYKNIETYKYDLVDITRQCVANKARLVYADIIQAYQNGDKQALATNTALFIQLIDDQDKLMGTLNEFLLGKWIKDARAWGKSPQEKNLMEYNAKLLLTLWRKNTDSVLHEYSHREWNGLLGSLYKTRWQLFFDYLTRKLQGEQVAEINFFEVEKKWIEQQNTNYKSAASGDAIEICKSITKKYF